MGCAAPIDDAALVGAWSVAQRSPPWRRPLAFLDALGVVPPGGDADQLSLGQVTAELLRCLPRWWAGGLAATAPCAGCGAALEIEVPVDALVSAPVDAAPVELVAAGHRLVVRPVRPADLAAVTAEAGDIAGLLLHRCLLSSDPPLDDADDIDAVAAEVEAALDVRDPLAAVSFAVTCPSCGGSDTPAADLSMWAWALADARARQLLVDVHRLATAYGWSERDVLSLGPHRRAAYLELVS